MTLLTHLGETLAFACLGVLISLPLIVLNIRWAPRLGLIDWPKARGVNEEKIALVGYSLVGTIMLFLAVLSYFYTISPWVITTAILMAVVGYYDDVKPLTAIDKLFFQVISAATVVFLDPFIHLNLVQKYGGSAPFVAIFFIVGLINAINFIDGIDGLAGMIIWLGALGFILLSHTLPHHYAYFAIASMVLGLMVIFLYLNVFRRKGFLGNIGSYFFSYLLAVLHLSVPLPSDDMLTRISLSALCFLVPVADACTVIVTRLLSRRSPFQPDRTHLHHRLIQANLPLRYVLLSFAVIESIGIIGSYMLNRTRGVEFSYLTPAIFLSYIALCTTLITLVEISSRKRLQGLFKRLEARLPVYFFKYELKRADNTPIPASQLKRLELRISSEIRISDLCFIEAPNRLFISFSSLSGPLKGISSRLENIFAQENVQASRLTDQGEIAVVSYPVSQRKGKAA